MSVDTPPLLPVTYILPGGSGIFKEQAISFFFLIGLVVNDVIFGLVYVHILYMHASSRHCDVRVKI